MPALVALLALWHCIGVALLVANRRSAPGRLAPWHGYHRTGTLAPVALWHWCQGTGTLALLVARSPGTLVHLARSPGSAGKRLPNNPIDHLRFALN